MRPPRALSAALISPDRCTPLVSEHKGGGVGRPELGDDGSLIRDGLRVRSVGVRLSFALDGEEHDDHDPADQRDEADQQPPATPAGVVQPADADGLARQQHCRGVEPGEQSKDECAAVAVEVEHAVAGGEHHEDGEHNGDDHAGQRERPVLLPPGAAAAIGVLAKHLQVPLHDRPLSFDHRSAREVALGSWPHRDPSRLIEGSDVVLIRNWSET